MVGFAPALRVCSVARALVDCTRYPCGPGPEGTSALVHRALTYGLVRRSQLIAELVETRAGKTPREVIETALSSWDRSRIDFLEPWDS